MEDHAAKRIVDLSHVIERGHGDLQGPAGPAYLRLPVARSNRPPITTMARPSRSAGSTWSRTRAPMSTSLPPLCRRQGPVRGRGRCLAHLPGNRRPAAVGERPRGGRGGIRWARRCAATRCWSHTGWDRHWGTDALLSRPFVPDRRGRRLAGRARRRAGRHRQPQYRRHAGPDAAGSHEPARRRNPDLRAYDRARQLPDGGFRFSAAPPKVQGMGTFPVRAYAVLD